MIITNQKKFDVLVGIDMETDIGSFTSNYNGVKYGTPKLLSIMNRHNIRATYFWTGHAAENNPEIVKKVRSSGHEIGCHGLVHETLGDPIFPLPNNWPVFEFEVEERIRQATKIVKKASGVKPVSFRCPRLWGSTKIVKTLEKLGYCADATLPLYFYRTMLTPYHPSARDWTRKGKLKIVEIPNFCDLTMKSKDPKYNRDRDQWPLFRTRSAKALLEKIDGFVDFVQKKGHYPVIALYFHPWEFHSMPQGAIDFGEASVRPLPFITKNCGPKALYEFEQLCIGILKNGGKFLTAKEIAGKYKKCR